MPPPMRVESKFGCRRCRQQVKLMRVSLSNRRWAVRGEVPTSRASVSRPRSSAGIGSGRVGWTRCAANWSLMTPARLACSGTRASRLPVERAGGRIVMLRTVLAGIGTLFFFEDTEGNVLGAMEYDAQAR
jgi:hypothetical protein